MKFLHVMLAILVCIFLASCSIVPEPIEVKSYIINSNSSLQNTSHKTNSCTQKSIKLSLPKGSVGVQSINIYYHNAKGEFQPYRNSFWAELPSISIKRVFYVDILKSNIFTDVSQDGIASKENFILNSDIIAFNQDISKNISTIKFGVIFSLLDAQTKNLLDSKSIYIEKPTKTNDAQGVSMAFNEAVNEASAQVVLWLDSFFCK